MKPTPLRLAMATMLLLVFSCKKENHSTYSFDYTKAAGIWVPYQTVGDWGGVHNDDITTNSLFGSYAGSVELNADQTYIPVHWTSRDHYILKTEEAGTYEYIPDVLVFYGFLGTTWELVKFEDNELWLKLHARDLNGEDVIVKFRKQL